MSENIEQILRDNLSDVQGIGKVGGDLIPLPTATGTMNNHLFVNLSFSSSSIQDLDTKEILGRLREIAIFVFKTILRFPKNIEFSTVVVSVFSPLNELEGLRLYRTRLRAVDLSVLNEKNYKDLVTGEESSDVAVRALLEFGECTT